MTDTPAGETPAIQLPAVVPPPHLWKPGQSGNPKGRPPSIKDGKTKLTHLKQNLEIAVRENLSDWKIAQIINAMVDKAIDGDVRAAKLILDKVVSNAGPAGEDDGAGGGPRKVVFEIQNATFAAIKDRAVDAIDVSVIEVAEVSTESKGPGEVVPAEQTP